MKIELDFTQILNFLGLLTVPFCTVFIIGVFYVLSDHLFYKLWGNGMLKWLREIRNRYPQGTDEIIAFIFEAVMFGFCVFVWLGILALELFAFGSNVLRLVQGTDNLSETLAIIAIDASLLAPVIVNPILAGRTPATKEWLVRLLKLALAFSAILTLPLLFGLAVLFVFVAAEAFAQVPGGVKYLIDQLPRPPRNFGDYLSWFATIISVFLIAILTTFAYGADIALIVETVKQLQHINSENWPLIFALVAEIEFLIPLVLRILGYKNANKTFLLPLFSIGTAEIQKPIDKQALIATSDKEKHALLV